MSGWQLIRLAAVSLLSRVSSITAKHHNKKHFLKKNPSKKEIIYPLPKMHSCGNESIPNHGE
jgi:hypothetical protein